MNGIRHAGRSLVWLVCWSLALAGSLVHAAPASPGEGAKLPSLTEIEKRLEAAASSTALSADEKDELTRYLEAARTALVARKDVRAQAQVYANALLEAPAAIEQLDRQITDYQPPPLVDPARLTAKALESRLAERRMALRDLKDQVARIQVEIQEELSLDLNQMVAETRAERDRLIAPATGDLAVASQLAATQAHAAQQALLRARVDMLEQRLLSRAVRLNLMRKRLDLLAQQISSAEAQVEVLSQTEYNQSLDAAGAQIELATALVERAEGGGDTLRKRAARNLALARELRSVIEQRADAAEQARAMAARVSRVESLLGGLTEQLEALRLGQSAELGAALLRQRALLESGQLGAPVRAGTKEALTELQLRQFELFEISQVEWLVSGDSDAQATAASDDPALRSEIAEQRTRLINQLTSEYVQYDQQLVLIDSQVRQLRKAAAEYRMLVEQHLLWNPSAHPFDENSAARLLAGLPALTGLQGQPSIFEPVLRVLWQRPLLVALSLLLVAGLYAFKRGQLRQLRQMRDQVGRVQEDRFGLTLRAGWLTVLFALPFPLLLATPGLISLIEADGPLSIAYAFGFTGLLYFGFEFFRQSLRENGLAALHFNWQDQSVQRLRQQLRWLMPLFLPPAVTAIILHFLAPPEVNASIGRLGYVLAAVAFAAFTVRLLSAGGGPVIGGGFMQRPQYRYAIGLLGAVLPLLFAGLALFGYQYTAELLGVRLLMSLGVLVGSLLLYFLLVRGIAISERRLALSRLRAQRAAAQEERHAQGLETEPEAGPITLESNEIDLDTINEHSRALVRLVVFIGAVFAFWSIWADLPVAFEPLQGLTLWQVSTEVDGVAVVENVTVWSLVAALLVVLVAYLGVRNIPGTLEVLVLSRLPLATGMNYAITSLVTYVIVLAALVTVLQLLGAQWSKLQWLIAALGVGLGFGLQEIVANFVSGLVILFERPVRLGDTITLGDQSGIVTRIRIRATTIIDWDRKEILIPNKAFITERLINWTLTDPIMRVIVPVGVAYGSDVPLVEKSLLEVARNNARVLNEPAPSALFLSFGDNSLGFELRVFIAGIQDLVAVKHELHKAIDARFRQEGIEISFPQRDIHLDSGPIEIALVDRSGTRVGGVKPSDSAAPAPGMGDRSATQDDASD